mmetsp:Transcript_37441/g.60938  ORF Transcript_37441/g.60938 Transcript_37441/m.60938 type:complete len:118 (+) Transcript_37441:167-520(+)
MQGLDIDFAFEVVQDIKLINSNDGAPEEDLNATTENCASDQEPLFIKVGERIIDVNASLLHVFQKHQDNRGGVSKCKLRSMLSELDLTLDDDEHREALLAFGDETISFNEFKVWWCN